MNIFEYIAQIKLYQDNVAAILAQGMVIGEQRKLSGFTMSELTRMAEQKLGGLSD